MRNVDPVLIQDIPSQGVWNTGMVIIDLNIHFADDNKDTLSFTASIGNEAGGHPIGLVNLGVTEENERMFLTGRFDGSGYNARIGEEKLDVPIHILADDGKGGTAEGTFDIVVGLSKLNIQSNKVINGSKFSDHLVTRMGDWNDMNGQGGDDGLVIESGRYNSLFGNDGNDVLVSKSGNGNKLFGGYGADELSVRVGNGILMDGGREEVRVGAMKDKFEVHSGVQSATIANFDVGVDEIHFVDFASQNVNARLQEVMKGDRIERYDLILNVGDSVLTMENVSASTNLADVDYFFL